MNDQVIALDHKSREILAGGMLTIMNEQMALLEVVSKILATCPSTTTDVALLKTTVGALAACIATSSMVIKDGHDQVLNLLRDLTIEQGVYSIDEVFPEKYYDE